MSAWMAFAAQFVMVDGYELWQQYRKSRSPYVRRIGLKAKTRALIAHDKVLLLPAKL